MEYPIRNCSKEDFNSNNYEKVLFSQSLKYQGIYCIDNKENITLFG